jgi:hypothetical protein
VMSLGVFVRAKPCVSTIPNESRSSEALVR